MSGKTSLSHVGQTILNNRPLIAVRVVRVKTGNLGILSQNLSSSDRNLGSLADSGLLFDHVTIGGFYAITILVITEHSDRREFGVIYTSWRYRASLTEHPKVESRLT